MSKSGLERERKFAVNMGELDLIDVPCVHIMQGYIAAEGDITSRVRIVNRSKAFLTNTVVSFNKLMDTPITKETPKEQRARDLLLEGRHLRRQMV